MPKIFLALIYSLTNCKA